MPLSCNNNSVIVQRREKVTISYGYLKENRNLLGLDRFFIYCEEERGRSILHSCKEAESKVSIPARKAVLASAEKQDFAHAMKSCRKSDYEHQLEAHTKDRKMPSKAGETSYIKW